jgi:uncharacterized protein YciI
MSNNLFVVILKYIAPLEKIEACRPEHLKFLDEQYAQGTFIASGPQIPRTGGIILARGTCRETLANLLKNDPFFVQNLATYEIFETSPTRQLPEFKALLER